MDNGPKEKTISQWRYNYCWKLTFPAPENKDILPRKKFATLLSMIGQFWPLTVLNTWADADLLQGLTNGKDLPYLRDDLVVYCPHVKRKTRLETMWNLASEVTLQTMKKNRAFMQQLAVHKIFINVTTLTTVKREVWVWCAMSHPNQTCRDEAKAELNTRLALENEACKLTQYL
eukprot:7948017-Ditylum_brightwellii.AAC.2